MARRTDTRINRPNTLAPQPYNGTDSRVVARGPGGRGASSGGGYNEPAMPVGVNPTNSQVRAMPERNAGYVANGGSRLRVNTPPTPVGVNPSDSATMVGAAMGRGINPAVRDSNPIAGLSDSAGEAQPPNPNPGSIGPMERRESGPKDYQPPVEQAPKSLNQLLPSPSMGDALMAAASSHAGTSLQDAPSAWGSAPETPQRGTTPTEDGGLSGVYGGNRRKRPEARNAYTA